MDFYKKLKVNKSSNNENTTDLLSIVERKLADMQPIIQDPAADKSKVQKTISDMKIYVESLRSLGGPVTADQQERIKEVTRKYKEMHVKYSNVSDISAPVPKSPMIPRKTRTDVNKEPGNAPRNKVALLEVEEKLKSMRQRRLDRLSVFVAEQSKLSEERSQKNIESSEIEDAIKSIQKTEIEKKINLKSVVEENMTHTVISEETNVKGNQKVSRTRSNESTEKFKSGKSSTLRFINKFNCTIPQDASNEDLTTDLYQKPVDGSQSKSEISGSKENDLNKKTDNSWIRDKINETHMNIDHSNPLLSPIGKQRRAIYLYDHECQFLEKEKRSSLPPLSTFGKDINQENTVKKTEARPKIHTYENTNIIVKNEYRSSPNQVTEIQIEKAIDVGKDVRVRTKVKHTYENMELIENRRSSPSSTKSTELTKTLSEDKNLARNSKGDNNLIDGGVIENKDQNISTEKETKIKNIDEENKVCNRYDKYEPDKIRKLPLYIPSELNIKLKDTVPTPRSPLPLPRRSNHVERVLKKMQRNWESLNEIIENDSDVDSEEIDDLKKTWEETNLLLTEYKSRITKLEKKSREEVNIEKLNDIKRKLEHVADDIRTFKGLKRDSSYMQLSNTLSNYFLDINKMHFSFEEAVSEKEAILIEIDKHIKELERKVVRNEGMLMEVLDAQVSSIGTNYLCITKV